MRGKGLGRRLLELTDEYLRSNFLLVTHSVAVLGNHDIPDIDYEESKHGKKLTERAGKTYQLIMNDETIEQLAAVASKVPSVSSQNENLVGTTLSSLQKENINRFLEINTLSVKL